MALCLHSPLRLDEAMCCDRDIHTFYRWPKPGYIYLFTVLTLSNAVRNLTLRLPD